MHRREFLLASTLPLARAQPLLSGQRGVWLNRAEDFDSAKLAWAKVQFVAFPFVAPAAMLAELKRLGIAVESRRPEAQADPWSLRRYRNMISVGPPFESLVARAVAHGSAFQLTTMNLDEVAPAYRKFAEMDPWLEGSRPIVDMCLLSEDRVFSQMLADLHEQFDIEGSDYSAYKLLIVPNPRKADTKKLEAYHKFGGSIYTPPSNITREAFAEALRTRVPKPAVIAPGLPAEAEVTFLERRTPGGLRRVGHVLYYPNDKPGVLENVQLSFRLPQHPLGVITIPDQLPIEFVHNEFLTTFTLPKVTGHQAIAFE